MALISNLYLIWVKVFKNGPSKIRQTISLQVFKGCLPNILLGPISRQYSLSIPTESLRKPLLF